MKNKFRMAVALSLIAPAAFGGQADSQSKTLEPTNVQSSHITKIARGEITGKWRYAPDGLIYFGGNPLNLGDLLGEDVTSLETGKSPRGDYSYLIYNDIDGLDQLGIFDHKLRRIINKQSLPGITELQFSPNGKFLFVLADYEGQNFLIYDLERNRLAASVGIAGRGERKDNLFIDGSRARNWHFVGQLKWSKSVSFLIDEYDAKPYWEDGYKQRSCRVRLGKDRKIGRLKLTALLDGSNSPYKIAEVR